MLRRFGWEECLVFFFEMIVVVVWFSIFDSDSINYIGFIDIIVD